MRHIILFSDATDSEQSDACQNLIDGIAKPGKDRIFYTEKAEELPAIYSQETDAVARSLFIDGKSPRTCLGNDPIRIE